MRRFFTLVIILASLVFIPIVYGAPARDGGATFGDVEGKEWILLELRSAGETVAMDRQRLEADGMGGVYTVGFQEERPSGMGAPNRYFGPYSSGANRSLSIGNIASTMMFSFREPEGLRESEYFDYLSKVTRWDLLEGKLELYSSNAEGAEAVLVFTDERQ